MSTEFQIKALNPDILKKVTQSTAVEKGHAKAQWLMVDSFPGYPCRVSLEDARVGERVLLLCYPYHEVNSPYRAAGPIFIREHAIMAEPLINHIPAMLKVRPQSVRAYDQSGHMLAAEVVVGEDLKPAIIRQLENPHIQYLHLHNAGPGCFNCTVMRA